jgi:hypothetical protein
MCSRCKQAQRHRKWGDRRLRHVAGAEDHSLPPQHCDCCGAQSLSGAGQTEPLCFVVGTAELASIADAGECETPIPAASTRGGPQDPSDRTPQPAAGISALGHFRTCALQQSRPIRSPRRRGPAAAKAIAAARDGQIKPACFVSQEDEFSVSRSPLRETRPTNFRETTQYQPRRPRGNRRQMFAMWESA